MKDFSGIYTTLGIPIALVNPTFLEKPYYFAIPSMIFNSKGYPSTSSLSISPPSASNTTDGYSSDSNTLETQSSSNPEPHPLTTESITNSLISIAKHHRLSMSTDELYLSRNTCVPDPDLIPACPSWEQFLESTYPTQPPSLNENQTYLTTSTN
ncbi:hypothetical protein O181_044825 [Austropuccinia psidii MF-1]|uniref:Uncharacterized protein n=1 Tax=Austropuccinia psidii MF-1 TaxID=1389203 RepID=A0A9Q3DKR5_9BASI|nr:hypothetical protein [Austropuccinia psidii MF-1]